MWFDRHVPTPCVSAYQPKVLLHLWKMGPGAEGPGNLMAAGPRARGTGAGQKRPWNSGLARTSVYASKAPVGEVNRQSRCLGRMSMLKYTIALMRGHFL